MRISLGPILYFWEAERVRAFYRAVRDWPVDIVYLGETVCAKRRELRPHDWVAIADELADAGKEVVLSTLGLIESEADLSQVRRMCENGRYAVEANDLAAVELAAGAVPLVIGPGINAYNHATLDVLRGAGAVRWVPPVETSRAMLQALHAQRDPDMAIEWLAFGPLPLAHSARCFTARAHQVGKDQCGFCCIQYPSGLPAATLEHQHLFELNGVQVLSAQRCNLLPHLAELRADRIDIARISPLAAGTEVVVRVFAAAVRGTVSPAQAQARIEAAVPGSYGDGYWRGVAGLTESLAGVA